jgi:hypothetical protein
MIYREASFDDGKADDLCKLLCTGDRLIWVTAVPPLDNFHSPARSVALCVYVHARESSLCQTSQLPRYSA